MTFLKWAGSKRQIVPKLKELLPPDFQNRRYIEPMVGGGGLFFALQPKSAILADANAAHIMAYHDVQHSVAELLTWLESWKTVNYDVMREHYRAAVQNGHLETVAQSARFIWLNKMGFNGLYCVNKDGVFNVPKGSRTVLPDMGPALIASSKALQHTELRIAGFEDTIHTATAQDFVYFDPPYLGENTFTAYTESKFGFGEHARLRWVCGQLDQKGVPWMLSSSDHHKIRSLYDEYNITEVKARRAINSDGAGRGEVTELVIRNY
jgi:DNA adenine methylase